MPSIPSLDPPEARVLGVVADGRAISQRSVAREVGIALGLTNLLLRRLVGKGLVRLVQVKPNRVRYLATPAGIAEKARMSRDSLLRNVRFYSDARDRIRDRFRELGESCVPARSDRPRVVFFGCGDVAEIGYVCLQDTGLELVGVADEDPRKQFFGLPVHPPSALDGSRLAGVEFDRLIVMSFIDDGPVAAAMSRARVSPDLVFWL